MEKAVSDYNEKIKNGKCFVFIGPSYDIDMDIDKIAMEVTSCAMSGDKMTIEATSINTPAWKSIEKCLGMDLEVIPNMMGEINKDGIVNVNQVISFSIVV
jgi:hypothetical protein